VIAHGSLALFHAMCKDNNEAKNILLKAGTDIQDDEKKAKDVVFSYINAHVNNARQWRSFLVKIVELCRTDILRLIAKHKKVEMGAHGGLALLHPAQPKDLAAQAILKKAGAQLPHGNTLVHMLLAYIEDAIHDKKQWTKFLSKIVVLQQVDILRIVVKHREDHVRAYGGVPLFHAMEIDAHNIVLILMEAGTRIQAEDHAEVLSHLSSDDSKIDWTTFLVGLISVGQHALLAYIAPKMKHKLTADGGLALFQACVRGNKLAFETLCNAEANITQDLHVMIGLMLHATPMQAVDWKILLTNLVIAKQAGCIEFLARTQ